MGGLLLRLKSWWDGADKNQRTITIVGGGFLIFLITVTFMFASKPHMGLLASGLTPAQAGTVDQKLQKLGVPHELDSQGNIQVPVDQVDQLRAQLSMDGTLTTANTIDSELDKMNVMSPPKVEDRKLLALTESSLATTIQGLDGVETAEVHIAPGDSSPFAGDHSSATASVTLHEKAGAMIGREQARGIARMVASAVQGLDLANVTVLNSRGEPLVDPDDAVNPSSKVAMKNETERAEAKRRERELQAKLDQAFGPGSTIVTVDLGLDFQTKQVSSIEQSPTKPHSLTESTESMTGDGANPGGGGLAGAEPNSVNRAPASVTTSTTGGGKSYTNKQTQKEFLVNEVRTQSEDPAGKLKRMSISILADKGKFKGDVSAIQDYADAYIAPLKAADTNAFTTKVLEADFDKTMSLEADKAKSAASTHSMMQSLLSIVPILALVAIAAMVLKSVGRFAKTQTLAVTTADGQVIPLPSDGLPLTAEMLAQYTGHHPSHHHGHQHAPKSGDIKSDTLSQITEKADDWDEFEEEIEVHGIRKKVNIPLEQIKKMADQRPEFVATLIKGWLMSEGNSK